MKTADLATYIRDIPDFPKKGIIFKDITPLLHDKDAFQATIDELASVYKDEKIDGIIGIESRGFIFAAALAYKLKLGLIPVRKKGKLPYKTKSVSYQLEYGTDTLEIHADAIKPNARILIIDDLLATGGTVQAVSQLVKEQNAQIVGLGFVIELNFLKGRDKLNGMPVYSMIQF
jgi:adenine phosphoribosyltransferase